MPTDPAMLEKLGLRDIPRWYREKFGVPSLLPNGRHNHHNQQWKDETAAADRTAVKAIQYHPHLGQDTSETEKAPKKPTPYFNAPHGAIPDQPRAFMNGLKGPIGQKNGTAAATGIKQISHAHGKKGDLLSFDPVSDYPSLDSMGGMGGMGAGNVTTGNELAHYSTEPDPRREEFVRSIQSLVPASVNAGPMGRLQSPFDATPCQTRGSRPQSRRLYQRANAAAAALQAGSSDDSFSFKGFRSALPTGTSNLSKASGAGTESTTGAAATGGGVEIGSTASQKLGNSPRARNIGGSTMSSDPPTRVVSPAENFSHSSLSSHSSPHDFYPRAGYDEYQIFQSHAHHHPPGAIGSKVVQRKVSDDVFDLGTGRK